MGCRDNYQIIKNCYMATPVNFQILLAEYEKDTGLFMYSLLFACF